MVNSSAVTNQSPVSPSLLVIQSKPGILRRSANAVGSLVMRILRLLGNFVYSPITFCNWAFGKKNVALPAQISQASAQTAALMPSSASSEASAPDPARSETAVQDQPPEEQIIASLPLPQTAPEQADTTNQGQLHNTCTAYRFDDRRLRFEY